MQNLSSLAAVDVDDTMEDMGVAEVAEVLAVDSEALVEDEEDVGVKKFKIKTENFDNNTKRIKWYAENKW